MPLALIVALAGSMAIHVAALFGTDVELFGGGPEPVPLLAELRPPPAPPAAAPSEKNPPEKPARPLAKPPSKASNRNATRPVIVSPRPAPASVPPAISDQATIMTEATPDATPEAVIPPSAPRPVRPPAKAVLAANGTIRFAVYKTTIDVQIGRVEQRWEFTEDGHYRLTGITETTGLAALFKPIRLVVESTGSLGPDGLQPTSFRTTRNGVPTNENADFDWASATVRLDRDGSVREIAPGTQDLLSLNYQLGYLSNLAEGVQIGVVTGKKYERYALDALGEEALETPAGHFRTLHLRAMTDNTTEIWIALDRQRLPVKIRFTDKKGESFEQIVTDMGGAAEPSRQTP